MPDTIRIVCPGCPEILDFVVEGGRGDGSILNLAQASSGMLSSLADIEQVCAACGFTVIFSPLSPIVKPVIG